MYPEAFWRHQGYSGNALQPYPGAVLAEIYDACSKQGESAALFGFFGLPAFTREHYRDNLEALIVQQITRLFGTAAANPLHILIQDCGESLFLSKDFPCSQRGNPQKYRDKFKLLRKPQPSCSP